MSELFEVTTSYSVKFTNKNPVPIEVIVESLISYEKLLKRTARFIEKAYDGIEVVDTEILVKQVESGSLREEFLIRHVFKSKENYENAKEVVHKIIEDNAGVKLIVAMSVGAIIGAAVVGWASSDAGKTHVEAYNNTIINIGGDMEFTADDVHSVLKGMGDKTRISKEVIGAMAPAQLDPAATLEVEGQPSITIPAQVLNQIPESYERPLPSEKEYHYDDIVIEIFASDRDKTESGWAGTVPGVAEQRVKFSLSDEVLPNQLHGKTKAKANITVVKKLRDRSYVPVLVEVHQITQY
tara:strand:- start:71747 stop:72634 length:888 start_codon:yes stop_codon:yes gene_type:complete